MTHRLAIIIINYNNWEDTLECIASLQKSEYKEFDIILIDNHSQNASVKNINDWITESRLIKIGPVDVENVPLNFQIINEREVEKKKNNQPVNTILFIRNDSNRGFAGASNQGIQMATEQGYDTILLLNNDTTVHPRSLGLLINFLWTDPQYSIITPKINYYKKPDKIWNCGGNLTWIGSRKYFTEKNLKLKYMNGKIISVSFVTGCALMAKTDLFQKIGSFTEKFFFGEEDYELSLRIKKYQLKMACVMDSIIYHKIGGSEKLTFKKDRLAKTYIYYLSRFINLRSYYSTFHWEIWRILSFFYILPLIAIKYHLSILSLVRFSRLLFTNSKKCNSVTSDMFVESTRLF